MDASTGWRRCGAEEETGIRCPIRREAQRGAREELRNVGDASRDRAPPVVRVPRFDLAGWHPPAHLDDVAKAGRETFDLCFDPLGHVDLATVGHVAVGVASVLPVPRARAIEVALLAYDQERAIGRAAFPHRLLG